ncbi:unnamed protein product [Effrenium voratum]|nr:unnamed protein product [Effrenium voratum]
MADPSVLRAELLRRLKEGESCRLVLGPCPAELLADEELMLKCLEFNAYVVEYLPAELLEKREIWLRAAKQNFNVLRRCPALLLDDKEFALQLVEVEPMSLKFLKGNDKEVVLHALEGSGLALEFADDSLRADRDVVRKAVQKDGLAHAFASEDLRRDEELALAALKSSTAVIRILPESLSRSMSFLLQAANAGGSSILRFLPEYAADKVFVQHVLKFD